MKNVSAKRFTNNEEEQRMKAIENRWKKCIEIKKIFLRLFDFFVRTSLSVLFINCNSADHVGGHCLRVAIISFAFSFITKILVKYLICIFVYFFYVSLLHIHKVQCSGLLSVTTTLPVRRSDVVVGHRHRFYPKKRII